MKRARIPMQILSAMAVMGLGALALSGMGWCARAQTLEPPGSGTQSPDAHAREIPRPEQQVTPSVDIDSVLAQARARMSALEYDRAIAILEPVLEATHEPELRRETYLLLVEAHVYRGNSSPPATKEQQLWYEEAHRLIRMCLGERELRRTRPEPPERYPAEMLQFFDDVRREIFGSFEITHLDPHDAEVILDDEVLSPGADGIWRAADVPIGPRRLVIRHADYEDLTEGIEIGPATLVSRSYSLRRKKGFAWSATRVTAAAVVAVGIVVGIVAATGKDKPAPVEPLPDPPLPPGK